MTVVIGIGTFFPGAGPLPFFASAWWFKLLSGVVFLGSLGGLVLTLAKRKWALFVGHLGVIILFAGIVADTRTATIHADLKEGETVTSYQMKGMDWPLGFAIKLVDFREKDYTSFVQLDQGSVRTIAPSHPISYKGWLLLQDSYDRTELLTRFVLTSETGETLRVETGQRFAIPGTGLEMTFDPDYVMSRDTLFRFHVYEGGTEKVSGFMSRKGIVPPTIKLGLALQDYELGGKYISILRLVRSPGAGVVFVSFVVMLLGLVMLAAGGLRKEPASSLISNCKLQTAKFKVVLPSLQFAACSLQFAVTLALGLALAVLIYLGTGLLHVKGIEIRLGWVALGLYLLSLPDYAVAFWRRRRGCSRPGDILFGIGLVAHLAAVILRGRIAGHLPFASRFEALLFYGLVTALLAYLINFFRKDLPIAFLSLPIVIVFMLGSLLGGGKTPQPLMPVLNSPFFAIHVVIAFIGYAFYTLNLGLAVGGLFAHSERFGVRQLAAALEARACSCWTWRLLNGKQASRDQSASKLAHSKTDASKSLETFLTPETREISRLGTPQQLFGLARQLVPFGLLFLGAGIALGGVWAMYSWGSWWGWDPKENAALMTWLAYVVDLHSPARKRRPGKQDAPYLIIAYVLLVLTFLGVNLLHRGLHAYQ
jgi:cytochrome c-type biogenesis protein CcsB